MRWFVPSYHGDFRLESAGEGASNLMVMKPTPHEVILLRKFLVAAQKKHWTEETIEDDETITTRTIALSAPIDKTGPALVKATKPKDRTLTAVAYRDGKLEVAEMAALTTLAAKAVAEDAKAAASVARPTLSCPRCAPGAVEPASEVLLSFLTPREHEDWAAHRAIIVHGGCSGHRYLVAHRHSDAAQQIGRICYDLDDSLVMHFHDTTVPPEEEVLAAELILKYREPWLRNEATVLWYMRDRWVDLGYMRYKNPFGDASDGAWDASLAKGLGRWQEP